MDENTKETKQEEQLLPKKKKPIGKIVAVFLLLAMIGGGITFLVLKLKNGGNKVSDELVFVESVENIAGSDYMGSNRYMGIVEAQETKGIQKDSDKKIKEIYVEVEDEVKEGDKLFEYDTEEMELKLRQMELELARINNSISTMNQQINSLAAEREEAPAESKLSYTAQIQNLQAQINQSNYDVSAKQLEIDKQKKAMENAVVYAPMNGIIKEINDEENKNNNNSSSNSYSESSSDDNAFIKIMAKGEYRVKATADEVSVRSMSQGQAMICYNRIGEPMSWKGTVSEVDLEHPDNGGGGDYYYGGGNETTTKYPFYIEIDDVDGLLLGQHVYVEPDVGQDQVKEGLWLDAYYIVQDENGAYVWAEGSDGLIKKQAVELGELDEGLMRYEILSGITLSDYIAYPEARIKEGMKATRNYNDILEQQYYEEQNGEGDGSSYGNGGTYPGGDSSYYEDYEDYSDDASYYDDYYPDEDMWMGTEETYYEEAPLPDDGATY